MIRYGEVVEIDPARSLARLRFADRDGMVSWWLQVLQRKTLKDRSYWMPDVGEHVAAVLDEREEAGVILGAVYSEADPPPESDPDVRRTVHFDGAVEAYDRKNHLWQLEVPAAGTIEIRIGRTSLVMTDAGVVLTSPRFDGVKA